MTALINNINNTLDNTYIVSTELYNKILKAMDNGQVIVFYGKLTNYGSFQYAIATPFVLYVPSLNIPVPFIYLEIKYFTINISEGDPFIIAPVKFVVMSDPMEEAELYEPQNFDILDFSSLGGGSV